MVAALLASHTRVAEEHGKMLALTRRGSLMRVLLASLFVLSACASTGPATPAPKPLASVFDLLLATRLEGALSTSGCLWTTDADGTLWSEDIGEGFLKQLISDHALVSPEAQGVDVWSSYQARYAKDNDAGLAWVAQVMAGMSEADVARRAEAFARSFVPAHLHPEMRALLEAAKARGCTPWIVSASVRWIVSAAAKVLGLPPEHTIGVSVAVKDGRLTSEVLLPIPYKSGKAVAIQRNIGQLPTIVTGDSSGDIEMFRLATVAALLIVHPGKTDPALVSMAMDNAWLTHEVPSGH
jgi:HAD superfamily phosphoserine phosphatase-like hydrolase